MEPNQPPNESNPNETNSAPIMDIAPPPVAPSSSTDQALPEPPKQEAEIPHEAPKKQKVTKPPKQPGSGVGLAIVATVIIVLGLGAIAAYAYIQTVK